ncbi:MAG: chloride channel protein [Melioribacteraceae bacterium]|nr:chloride channel protein [Melioribacteraceae bacterium]
MINEEKATKNYFQKLLDWFKNLIFRIYHALFLTDYTTFTFLSIITGAVVGFATVLFHHSIEFFNEVFFKQTAGGLYFLGAAAVIALPAIGMLIQSLMIIVSPDIAAKRGVAEVIKSVASRGARIPLRTTIFHFFAPVISIGSGNTMGPEAPAAQLGGGVANKLAHLFKLSDSRKRVFTAAGSGAAIAAIFNTPMGGIFFALEIILLNEFQAATFSALILATVTSSAISRIFLGNTSVFIFHSPNVGEYSQLYLYAILGIAAGLISLLFIKYSNTLDNLFKRKILKRYPQWIVMTLVGLIVGVSGYFYKDIFGIGYIGINNILANLLSWKVVVVLLTLKIFLVPLILNSGGFGGVFAPSLFIGACLGYLYAVGLNYFFGFQFDVTAFILVGMGAVLGGINSIPISAILIIFEMTKDYSFILPLMLAVVASTMIVQGTLKKSVHERHLEKQGYRISQNKEFSLLKSISVEQVMNKDIILIPEETPLPKVLSNLMENERNTFYTVNRKGAIVGMISYSEIRPIITEYEHIREVLVAGDIASKNFTTLLETDDLDYVMKLFESNEADEFPVVGIDNKNKVIGAVRRQDVIAAYNRESFKYNVAEGFARELKTISNTKQTKVMEGFSIVEKTPLREFIGKNISAIGLRSKYELEILMIRRHNSPYDDENDRANYILPNPQYVIKENDLLILFGADEKIALTEQWNID